MKPPEPKPLSPPLLLRVVKRCPKCGRVSEGRADDMAFAMFGLCFLCCHPRQRVTRKR